MVKSCCVDVCRNRLGVCEKRYFRVPIVEDKRYNLSNKRNAKRKEALSCRRAVWLSRIFGSEYTDSGKELHVCSDHFISGKPSNREDQENIDWAPSLRLGHNQSAVMQGEVDVVEESSSNQNQITEAGNEEPPTAIEDAPETSKNMVDNGTFCEKSPQSVESVRDYTQNVENCDEVFRDHTDDAHDEVSCDASSDAKVNADIGTQTVKYLRDCGTQVQRGSFTKSISVQTELTMQDISKIEASLSDATKKLNILQVSEDTYRDNEITRYYTGLPNYDVLLVIFNLVSPFLTSSPKHSLSKFQQFVLTLMKLRLNLYTQDLAFRFGVSRSTVSRTFQSCIEVMYWRIKRNVFWPERPIIQSTMPQCFKESFKDSITVIIDCFEIVMEKPSNLKAKAQTWSNYKHNQTLKFLLAITPQGFICFISRAFGGRSTDKFITETCGFLENLSPGDVVMADRGFLIEDSVGFHMAKVVMPAFTKGLQQLSPTDVENTRQIANVRIHVERVIANLRQKYRILSNRVPVSLANSGKGISMDEIATVCCSLINFCGSVVPLD